MDTNDYILIGLCALQAIILPLIAYVIGRRSRVQASNEDAMVLREESSVLESKLIDTLSEVDHVISKAQLASIGQRSEGLRQEAAELQQTGQGLTERVDKTRYNVQQREREQQELRSMREEDEVAIREALSRYDEFSTESLTLEQRLAESLRTVDAMSTEIKMTSDQQAVFTELSNALTQASGQLRDVIVDYHSAHERLSTLQARFLDLESEYSKLIEQQLAG
jgi:chromosome segregation ATPase